MTVPELLDRSWQAHQRYRSAAGSAKKAPDGPVMRQALLDAYTLRVQAHEADPEHADPAWISEQGKTLAGVDTHDSLMTFYKKKLSL